MKIPVTTLANKKAGDVDLDDAVFGLPVRKDLLQRAVRWQLAKRRAGTHKVRTVSEISGTNAKPFRQKGTGRARAGTNRATQMRGGATKHGPVVRDHGYALPKKVRRLALKTALSTKQSEGKLTILDAAELDKPRTRDLAARFAKLGWTSALIIDGPEVNENFARAAANLSGIDVLPQQGANVYDILRRDTLVLTKAALEALQARLK